jgi:hypothetical protein
LFRNRIEVEVKLKVRSGISRELGPRLNTSRVRVV